MSSSKPSLGQSEDLTGVDQVWIADVGLVCLKHPHIEIPAAVALL